MCWASVVEQVIFEETQRSENWESSSCKLPSRSSETLSLLGHPGEPPCHLNETMLQPVSFGYLSLEARSSKRRRFCEYVSISKRGNHITLYHWEHFPCFKTINPARSSSWFCTLMTYLWLKTLINHVPMNSHNSQPCISACGVIPKF